MTKVILAALLVFSFSALADDTHGTTDATTTETTMPAEGATTDDAHGKMDKGTKMAKKAAKGMKDGKGMKKKEKKEEHAH